MSIQSGLNLQVCKIGLLSMLSWWMMNGWDDQNKPSFNPIKLALWCLFVNVSKWSSVCQIPFSVGEWSLSESGGSDLPDVAKYFHFHNSIQNTFTFTKVYKILSLSQKYVHNTFPVTTVYKIISLSQIYTRYFRFHNFTQNIFTLTTIYEPCWLYTYKIDNQHSQAKSMRPRAFWLGVLSRKGGYELWIASLSLPSYSGWVIRT